MYITAEHLREQVIRPTLKYLGEWSSEAERQLLTDALRSCELRGTQRSRDGLGLFGISSVEHRDLWDRFLAFRPDLASRVRGLASQRAFLSDPDLELQTNLSYCVAIAWMMKLRQREQDDWQSIAPAMAPLAAVAHA
ncbi:MAG: hypothetical protein V2I82_05115 [Halieaceae bacterium]|jgi:hypothetical protein|nr:hypothetical protein [Halieaceae bacterium]